MPIIIKGILIGSGTPLVCAPVMEKSSDLIIQRVREARSAGIRCVEWRADFFEDLFDRDSLRNVLERLRAETTEMVLIATVRSKEQGGQATVSSLEMHRLLLDISTAHAADFIDVEFFEHQDTAALIRVLHNNGAQIIASWHDFGGTPEEDVMLGRLRDMAAGDPDIVKIAVMPGSRADAFSLMRAAAVFKDESTMPLIAISMGEQGRISRVAAESFGGCITFGSFGEASAPGQMDAGDLTELLDGLNGKI